MDGGIWGRRSPVHPIRDSEVPGQQPSTLGKGVKRADENTPTTKCNDVTTANVDSSKWRKTAFHVPDDIELETLTFADRSTTDACTADRARPRVDDARGVRGRPNRHTMSANWAKTKAASPQRNPGHFRPSRW